MLDQTYKNTEIIIIDGGSTDNTIDVIKKYAGQIRHWVSEKDKGQSNAINKGLLVASGEIVTWLNSDDYYEPDALLTVVKTFHENPSVTIVHGKARLFGERVKSRIVGPREDLPLSGYLAFMRFPQPSSFIKREFLSTDFPLNEHLHYAMDFELVSRAILTGAVPKRTDQLFSHYRLHPHSKSNLEIRFMEEWTNVAYNTFSTLHNGNSFAQTLKSLSTFSITEGKPFACTIRLTDAEVEGIFLEHIHLHYHFHYRTFNRAACARICLFLKENYKGFYRKNNYYKYNFRLKFIPVSLITLIRKFRN